MNSNTVKKSEGLINMEDEMSYPFDWHHVSSLTTVGNVGRDVEGGGYFEALPLWGAVWQQLAYVCPPCDLVGPVLGIS